MKKIYCFCCGKQIVNYHIENDDYITCGPVKFMGCGKYCCFECGKDLDENGLFPEERFMEMI